MSTYKAKSNDEFELGSANTSTLNEMFNNSPIYQDVYVSFEEDATVTLSITSIIEDIVGAAPTQSLTMITKITDPKVQPGSGYSNDQQKTAREFVNTPKEIKSFIPLLTAKIPDITQKITGVPADLVAASSLQAAKYDIPANTQGPNYENVAASFGSGNGHPNPESTKDGLLSYTKLAIRDVKSCLDKTDYNGFSYKSVSSNGPSGIPQK